MASKNFLCVPMIIATMAWVSFGQTSVDLCGTVTNAAGGPVSGVTIKLQQKVLTTVSGNDGSYCIHWVSGVSAVAGNDLPKRDCAVTGKRLCVTLATGDRLGAKLFDLRGRILWKINESALAAGRHEILLPLDGFSAQAGLLLVSVGGTSYTFRFAGYGRESLVFSKAKMPETGRSLAKTALANGVFPILDTLVATGSGFAMNNVIRSYVYKFTDTIDFALGEPDSFSEARQQIVHRVNDYRGTLGLKRLIRNKAMDACVDTQAQMDYASGTAHSAFGHCKEFAQNECPGWTGTKMLAVADNIVTSCMQMMWDEGAPPAGTPCGGGTTCYSQHGHYINMTSTAYSKMACGFYYNTAAKTMCATQDFF
jgi:hypothetical protein